jgi:hypothetical protein
VFAAVGVRLVETPAILKRFREASKMVVPFIWKAEGTEREILTLPVVTPPKFKVWLFVVWIVPSYERYKPLPFEAEIEATGLSVATPVKANFALAVEFPPRSKSTDWIIGERAPFVKLNLDAPEPEPGHADHEGAELPTVKQSPAFPIASFERAVPAE